MRNVRPKSQLQTGALKIGLINSLSSLPLKFIKALGGNIEGESLCAGHAQEKPPNTAKFGRRS